MMKRSLSILVFGWCTFASNVLLFADDRPDYLKQIKPLLRSRCFACHGALKQEGGLRLDTVELMIQGGDSGEAIVAGSAAESLLLERIAAKDADERMPPEHEGEPLSAEQINLVREWIASGAAAPADEQPEASVEDHWAFQSIVRPELPEMEDKALTNPIDIFLAVQHEQSGIQPQVEAQRIIQLRRLSLDLIGIPPTAEEIEAFTNSDSSESYQQTVERLLNDPRHGERWARHWMDIWRYSDWWGLGRQLRRSQKHIWHWRDWIVESLNNDTGYDEMVRQMLAADELYPNDLDKLRATGYLARNFWLFNRTQWMDETVEHVSKGLLGLTMNCAKCHDHKYDPMDQVDYYQLRAFFEPYHVRLDAVPGQPDVVVDGIPCVFDGLLDKPTYLFVRGEEKNVDESVVIEPDVPEIISFEKLNIEPISLPAEAWQPERRAWVVESYVSTAQKKVESTKQKVAKSKQELVELEEKLLAEELKKRKSETAEQQPESTVAVSDIALSRQKVKVAAAAVVMADAELASIQQRSEAMQAKWRADEEGESPAENTTKNEREKANEAIRSERELAVAKAQHELAVAKLELLQADDKKKAAVEKKIKAAGDSLAKASGVLNAEIKETDKFANLDGAKWTPTRFLFSGKDDPIVEFPSESTGRRSALAKWITDRRNPLAARVAVNHIWTRHMGTPLVATVFDFGRNGARPTHPELLDWLAAELIDNNWSMKHLHRVIVSSAAYRRSSSVVGREKNVELDPDNLTWWRRVPIRMESQLVRDSLLSYAGVMDSKMGGPTIPKSQQDASRRRSLYFFHSNNERNLFLTTFDEALVTECYRREQSVVPQQALALTNSKLVHELAPQIAKRVGDNTEDEATFIRELFTVLLGIEASESEIAACTKALEEWRAEQGGSEENARTNLVWSLINHNDFVTLR